MKKESAYKVKQTIKFWIREIVLLAMLAGLFYLQVYFS